LIAELDATAPAGEQGGDDPRLQSVAQDSTDHAASEPVGPETRLPVQSFVEWLCALDSEYGDPRTRDAAALLEQMGQQQQGVLPPEPSHKALREAERQLRRTARDGPEDLTDRLLKTAYRIDAQPAQPPVQGGQG